MQRLGLYIALGATAVYILISLYFFRSKPPSQTWHSHLIRTPVVLVSEEHGTDNGRRQLEHRTNSTIHVDNMDKVAAGITDSHIMVDMVSRSDGRDSQSVSLPQTEHTVTTLMKPSESPTQLSRLPTPSEGNTPKRLFGQEMQGMLNYDVWTHITGYLVDDMRIRRNFPNIPSERKVIDVLRVTFNERDPEDILAKYSHKIYGYLLPPETGDYVFAIKITELTAACGVELWLSTDENPIHTRNITSLVYPELGRVREPVQKTVKSSPIRLQSGMEYYFEFLEKAFDGKAVVEIQWKTPQQRQFVSIPQSGFAMAVKLDSKGNFADWPVVKLLQGPLPSNQLQGYHRVQFIGDTVYPITDLTILPLCKFTSAFAFPHEVKTYKGPYEVTNSKVFPSDNTWHINQYKATTGNPRMSLELAAKVLKLYRKAFNESKYSGTVELRYLEETENRPKRQAAPEGSRFLLEMDVKLDGQADVVHTSEYVYLPAGTEDLCHTENFQWTKNIDVHIVVSVKNLGMWCKHLIHNMEYIYEQTHDDHFELIIVDYESDDVNLEEELKNSSLKRWKVIHKTGQFSRSGGLQAGIDYVTDSDSIVMTIDMHLTIPSGFVEYVRRHVVRGRMGVAPIFFRLRPGYTEVNINGFWEALTYGLLGLYKGDWMAFNGFDTEKYTTKWGGEDWDVLDRALAKGFEVYRIRYPGLMHYHHTRAGMWGNLVKKG